MRTTVTLDDDVAALVRQHQEAKGVGFKDALNDLLRQALTPTGRRKASGKQKPIRTFSVGKLRLENLDDISEVIEDLEGPAHR